MATRDLRPEWANKMCLALLGVHPAGLTPRKLQAAAGLTARQVRAAARYLRDTYPDDPMPPVVYVRRRSEDVAGNCWYYAATWHDHVRPSLESEYGRPSAERLASEIKLFHQAKRAFPKQARRLNKLIRTAEYLRDEVAELVTELAA